ncbi:monooxygenase [Candidatus Blochmanniella floridana]|uniref:Monooxygenase n=1 Tax=Blochmanniella floridana TaxID=203907 RepID=Q7VRA1_BLOFL|nr:monooxygenase [Candidatus Blochmannia floridanus]
MNKLFCEVLIFGAGIVGSSLALSLAKSGIKVIITDNKQFDITMNNSILPNIRVSAINYASVRFFKNIKIWNNIPSKFCTSYCHLKAWEWPSATLTFHSKSVGLSEMGYIVENNRLKLALWQGIEDVSTITFFCPSKLISLEYDGTYWKCLLSNSIVINSRLLIGADGIDSKIRTILGINITEWKYNQCCMLITTKTITQKWKKCNETIWQVFTPQGPIGFLPLHDNWGSLMWFGSNEYIQRLQKLPQSALEAKINHCFYKQLGKIKLCNTFVVPLIHRCAQRYIAAGGALVGDAAHTIHPLAGQGLNLGIRDVLSLSKLLSNSFDFSQNIINLDRVLFSYQSNRQFDINIMKSSIDFIYFIFHNNLLPLKITRNIAFMAIERFSYIKRKILQYAMGV